MVRQGGKRSNQAKEENQDVVFLLSCFRSRQNALIFFLELFAMATCQKLTSQQYNIYKQQFLQKQKINTQQIKTLVDKINNSNLPPTQIKTFWMKLKSIIRVSVERARTLGMLTDSLGQCYQYIIKSIDTFYTAGSSIKQYMLIQQLVKRRTIQALMATKHSLLDHPSQDFGKIRSETFLKGQFKPPESLSFSPTHHPRNNHTQQKHTESIHEMMVIKQEPKSKKKQKSKAKILNYKKINLLLNRCERNLYGIMDIRIDCHLDKKKSQIQNFNNIYDSLFNRNIANHKIITKYIHNSNRLAHKLMQMKRSNPKRRNFSQNKLTKKLIPEDSDHSKANNISKLKLARPQTSKPSNKKTIHLKGSSAMRTQKIYDLLKMM